MPYRPKVAAPTSSASGSGTAPLSMDRAQPATGLQEQGPKATSLEGEVQARGKALEAQAEKEQEAREEEQD